MPVHVSVIHEGVYVCFRVHTQMNACWECVWTPVCAKVVSWEGRAGTRGQVGDSVRPLGVGLCSQTSMHIYEGGIDPLASPWPQLRTPPLEAPSEPPPCPLWSNQPSAPGES